MSTTTPSDENETLWRQLTPHLDHAVAALSKTDRAAILLRFYERKPLREVGEHLGVSEDAAKKRVARAVEKLREFLTRRGVVLGGTVLVGVLVEQTVQAAPATLAAAVVKTSMAGASASGVLPQLARETLRAWRIAKLKLAAGIAAASVVGGFFVAQMSPHRDLGLLSRPLTNSVVAARTDTSATAQTPPAATTNPTALSQPAIRRFIDIHVVEARTKQPLPGVALDIFGLQREKITGRSDKQGRYEIELPEQDPEFLQVITHQDGFVSKMVFWHTRSGTFQFPGEFTFTLEPSTSIGGIVQDEQGQPIPGVLVSISLPWSNMAGAAEEAYANVDDQIVTDSQGRWQSDQVPADLSGVRISLKHLDYFAATAQPPAEKLRDMTGVMAMKRGLVVQGVVLGDDARPIEGATVMQGPMCCGASTPSMNTDAEGRFHFANLAAGPMILTFKAEGHAPELMTVDVNPHTAPLQVRLANGNIIHGKVIDIEGAPVAHAWVATDAWRGNRSLGWWGHTDDEGRFVWSNAPPDEVLFAFGKDGFVSINTPPYMPSLKASEEERVITLHPVLRVRGAAVDADTGLPVLNIKVIPGSTTTETIWVSWNEPGTMASTNGQYHMAFDQNPTGGAIDGNGHETAYTNAAYLVRVEADGYDPTNSRPFKADEGDVVFDFHLRKGSFVSGVVQATDGALLENADVILSTRNANNDRQSGKTDANGRFSLLKSGEDYSLTVTHDRGFAYVTREEFQTAAAIVVQPWGRIEGTLHIGSRPGTNETVVAATAISGYQTKAQTDGNGDFVMTNVPPLLLWLTRQSIGKPGEPWVYRNSLGSADVRPGETLHVILGGTGRTVIGHVFASPTDGNPIDWAYSRAYMSIYTSPPENFATMTDSEKLAWRQAWFKSAEGQAFVHNHHQYSTMIGHDGSFRIDDVADGTYRLNVTVNAPPKNRYQITGSPIAGATRIITVVRLPDGGPDEPLDLGEIELQSQQ